MNTGWREIDIYGCYSLVKIAFAPICACKNNRRIWRNNASNSGSRGVTDQLWWLHNSKSEKTALGDNGEIKSIILFSGKVSLGHNTVCKKWNDTLVSVNNNFGGHSWGDLPMIFTRDFVTRENHWQIASLVTQKSLFMVTPALFFITPLG